MRRAVTEAGFNDLIDNARRGLLTTAMIWPVVFWPTREPFRGLQVGHRRVVLDGLYDSCRYAEDNDGPHGPHHWSETPVGVVASQLDCLAKILAAYWITDRRVVNVSRFVPGEHFHCLGTKFGSLADAIAHIRANGRRYGGYEERRLPGRWL